MKDSFARRFTALRLRHLIWLAPMLAFCLLSVFAFINSRSQQNLVRSVEELGGDIVTIGEPGSGLFARLYRGLRKISNGMLVLQNRDHTYLVLRGGKFDDQWFKQHAEQLRKQPRLEMGLWNCGITDEGLRQLEPMPHLVSLSLKGGEITGKALTSPFCQSIQSLSISKDRQFAAGIPKECRLVKLKSVRVEDETSSPDLDWLIRQPALRSVGLRCQILSADSISQLNQCSGVTTINLSTANDEIISALTQLTIPVELEIQAQELTEKCLPDLDLLKVKHKLVLYEPPFTDEILLKLSESGIVVER